MIDWIEKFILLTYISIVVTKSKATLRKILWKTSYLLGCDTHWRGRNWQVILLRQSSITWQRGNDGSWIIMELIKYSHELCLIQSTSRSCPQGVSGFPAALSTQSVRDVHSRGSRSGQRAREWSTAAHKKDHLTSSTDVIYVLKVRKKHIGGYFVVFSRT